MLATYPLKKKKKKLNILPSLTYLTFSSCLIAFYKEREVREVRTHGLLCTKSLQRYSETVEGWNSLPFHGPFPFPWKKVASKL